jgi:hypothetical protein
MVIVAGKMMIKDGEEWNAIFSEGRKFRYELTRKWGSADPHKLLFVMLNPSIADEQTDDPTQRRCRGFAKTLGFDGYTVANIFALVSTDPTKLQRASNIVGAENDAYLNRLHRISDMTIAAWGTWGKILSRGVLVARSLSTIKPLMCLGQNKDGSPKHPLYLRHELTPRIFAITRYLTVKPTP